jgi:hypothetical protein
MDSGVDWRDVGLTVLDAVGRNVPGAVQVVRSGRHDIRHHKPDQSYFAIYLVAEELAPVHGGFPIEVRTSAYQLTPM